MVDSHPAADDTSNRTGDASATSDERTAPESPVEPGYGPQGFLGVDVSELPDNAVTLLAKAASLTRGTARSARRASRASIGVVVIWLLALALLGWLASPGGLILLALVAVAWFVAWLTARNLAATLGTLADWFTDLSREASDYQAGGTGVAGLPDEAIKVLRSAAGQDRLSLRQLRRLLTLLRDVRSTVDTVRALSPSTYTTGLLSYLALAAIGYAGLLAVVAGILVRIL